MYANRYALLQDEMRDLEAALINLPGKKKFTHTIRLPYGNIHLAISGRRTMAKDNNSTDLARQNNTGLFKPSAEDIFDDSSPGFELCQPWAQIPPLSALLHTERVGPTTCCALLKLFKPNPTKSSL